jgi:hypothetical protein
MHAPEHDRSSETMRPRVSILIVSYNTCAMTRACLDSIAAGAARTKYEIIVVDNASRDGSVTMIEAHAARPISIARQDNLGFAGGTNLAATHATGDLLLLLNPDTVVLPGAIDALVDFALARPVARIWGGRTLFADGRLNPSSAWGRMTLWRLLCRASGLTAIGRGTTLFNGEAIGGWARNSVREVDIVSGCFLLIARDDWLALGGFDPLFFMYGEEADLCLRAHAAIGARPAVTPSATIIHHGGASEATREGKMIKLLAAKASLIDRHFPVPTRALALALHEAWPLMRWLALAAAARITGRDSHRQTADVWQAIWQARDQWRRGYVRQASGAPIGAAASP